MSVMLFKGRHYVLLKSTPLCRQMRSLVKRERKNLPEHDHSFDYEQG